MTDPNSPVVATTAANGYSGQTETPQQRIWLITGGSSGFGLRLVRIALRRGDKVIATGRSIPKLQKLINECSHSADRLETLKLDFDDGPDAIKDGVDRAVSMWGRVDVLVNNASWGQPSLNEEAGPEGIQRFIDTNAMGTVNVTLSALPYMRAQKSGTIVTIGSRSAWKAELPGLAPYAIAKALVHAFTENLSAELAHLNIRVLLVQPGSFRTEGMYRNGFNYTNLIPDYDDLRTRTAALYAGVPGNEPGNPDKAMEAVVDVVRGEGVAQGRPWPKYLFLGGDSERDVRAKCKTVLGILEEWGDVTKSVGFDSGGVV